MIPFHQEKSFRERRRVVDRRCMTTRRRDEARSVALVPGSLFSGRQTGDYILNAHGEVPERRHKTDEAVRLEALLDLCEAMSPDATRRVLHELRDHQLQLETQNDELRRTQMELETAISMIWLR
jgi:hypothetical protein